MEKRHYNICIFNGNEIRTKTYFGITYDQILNKNGVAYEEKKLDLDLNYAFASGGYEKEYIYSRNGKTTYAYEFVVGAGDDFESTVYSCDTRLSKESLIEFDRLNSQNKIEWF